MLAQHLGQAKHQVGCGGPARKGVQEADPEHHRGREVHGLAEHAGFGFDSADAPAQHAEAVHHRGVGVRAHQRVGDRRGSPSEVADLHHPAQVLEVDLVADAHPRRDHGEVVEGLLGPAQQRVALAVPLVLPLDVGVVGPVVAEGIHLDGVVDHEVDRHLGVDPLGVLTGPLHGRAHRRQVHDRRDPREVLEQHAGRRVGDLGTRWRLLGPAGERLDAGVGGPALVGVAEEHLEEDLDGHRQPPDVPRSGALRRLQGVKVEIVPCQLPAHVLHKTQSRRQG